MAVQPGYSNLPQSPPRPLTQRAQRIQRKKRSKWQRLARYIYVRFIRLRGHPRAIARGLAAGTFAGSYPLFGLQTIIGVAIAAAIGGNKLVAAAGTWISNPLTYVPIYAFNYQVGRWILRHPPQTSLANRSPQEWMNLGFDITLTLMVGSTLVGIFIAIVSYYSSLYLAYKVKSSHTRH